MAITKDQIKFFLPSLTDEEVVDLEFAANCDSDDEGAEWLPWYKMSLSRLAACAGVLRSMTDIPWNAESHEKLLREAGELFRQHLLFCGIGPKRDAEHVEKCTELAERAMTDFMDGGV